LGDVLQVLPNSLRIIQIAGLDDDHRVRIELQGLAGYLIFPAQSLGHSGKVESMRTKPGKGTWQGRSEGDLEFSVADPQKEVPIILINGKSALASCPCRKPVKCGSHFQTSSP